MRDCGSQTIRCGFDPGNTPCKIHGPAVRRGKARPESLSGWGCQQGLTVLPTHAQRFGQLMREATKIEPEQVQKLAEHPKKLDPWTRALVKALNVNFEAQS